MRHVCYFRHALALDERRVKFLPEYAYGGRGLPDEDVKEENGFSGPPHTKEVWFAGVHSHMYVLLYIPLAASHLNDGSYRGGRRQLHKELDLEHIDPALEWMSAEACSLGLHMMSFRDKKHAEQDYDKIPILGLSPILKRKIPDKDADVSYIPERDAATHDSLTTLSPWWLLEGIFIKRLSYDSRKIERL